MRLFADFAARLIAFRLGHGLETVALAHRLAFAGVFRGLAVVHAFARRDAVSMHLSISRLCLGGDTGKHGSGGDRQGSTGNGLFDIHGVILIVQLGSRPSTALGPDMPLE